MIDIAGVHKTYRNGTLNVHVLRDVSMTIKRGEFVAIMGQSGSGKSTLMNVIGCLDGIDAGSYVFDGQAVSELGRDGLAMLRSKRIGFVFQSFNLIARMNALRNVELPMIYAGVARRERSALAARCLAQVGLSERAQHLPTQLSGGQQQRVAIARALANTPDLIIADEPTGSLDSETSAEIIELFGALNAAGKTVVLVTHEASVARRAGRVIRLRDGQVVTPDSSP